MNKYCSLHNFVEANRGNTIKNKFNAINDIEIIRLIFADMYIALLPEIYENENIPKLH